MSDNVTPAMPNRQVIDGRLQAVAAGNQLIQQAKREICFFAPSLDKHLLDNEEALTAISAFARDSRFSKVRLLVHSSRDAVNQSHRLLPLAQRLSSHIEIHECAREDHDQVYLCLLVDDFATLFCSDPLRYQGYMAAADRAQNLQLRQHFEVIWARSHPDPQSRRLHI
ncbi:MAG: hypothetical protein RQ732_02715 [Methylophaga sp.]|nr:hypothetical protein [Methylophaga sp.]